MTRRDYLAAAALAVAITRGWSAARAVRYVQDVAREAAGRAEQSDRAGRAARSGR